MALKGTLVYNKVNQSNLEQDVALTVYGMDTIAKLNLYMVYEGNDYNRDMDKWRLFDSVYDKNYENLEFNAENVGDEWRRLDISQAGKFTSNLQNKKFGAVVAATVRYVMTHGKNANTSKDVIDGYVIQGKDYNTVSESITYDEEGTEIGRFTKEYGILTKLAIHTPLMSLEMEEDTSTNNINDYLKLDGTKMFAPLKVKDKYGRITSKTPVKTNSYKLVGAFLGFPFKVQAVDDEDSTVVGMYQTMDEVIEAHPDKNFAWIKDRLYRIVSDDDLQEVMQGYYDYDGVIAIDTETTGLNINFKSRTEEADKLVGICLSKKEGTGDFIPLNMKHFPNVCGGDHWFFMEHYMKKFLESHKFVTHNLSFDWKVFYIYGINLNAVFDTMLAYSCTERYKHRNFEVGLKDLTRNIFGRDMIELSDFVYGMDWSKSGVKFWDLSYEQCRQYAPTDADSTLCLYNFVIATKLIERFEAQAIFEIELKYAKVIGYSEFWGYHINVDELPHLVNEVDNSLKHYKQEMLKIAGYEFNPDSPVQLGAVMYDELKMPKLHDARKTDKTTLKELSEINNLPHADFLTLLTEYRKSAGTYKNFIKRKDEFISEDGYIFPHVYSFGTDTGRCSIKEPNYQSYNDIIKKRVTPRRGFKMFDCDFSQIEYRVLCSIAQEENLKKSFSDPDMDYHTYQAARMFDVPYGAVTGAMRKQAKGFNFGLPYGMGDKSLGLRIFGQATKENTAKAAKLRIKYFVGQENIKKWFEVTRDNAIADGYSRTLFGRSRYYFKEIFDEAKIRRQAGNHVIQGCIDGNTRIQTKEFGIVKIKDVVGSNLNVWDGTQWTRGDITYSGKKRKCIVRFSGGMTMICSPIHKFLVRSAKGNDRFVECKDLLATSKHRTGHRVVVNPNYVPSDYVYNSKFAYKYKVSTHNAHNVFVEDISDRFGAGVVLGRLASDGTYSVRESGGSYITQIVAEHEYNIIPILSAYMQKLGIITRDRGIRPERTQGVSEISIFSKSLASEVSELDIKHQVHDNIFMDTEVLRGFLRGFFDGDGGVQGKTISLTFGVQYNFEPMCCDLQKALLFFGVRSRFRYYSGDRYVLQIKTNDNARFLDLIGFVNKDKQEKARELKCNCDEHIFGKCLLVESVEITDDYIDMYDVCNTERGYYVADGVITHNTAADIYKMACNRFFDMIVAKGWLDKVLMDAFIHDEILGEVSDEINPFEFVEAWRTAFEVPIEGFCKLYAGFGMGNSWYEAKKQDLTPPFIEEIITSPLRANWNKTSDEFIAWIYEARYDYELRRVIDYFNMPSSQGEIIKPIIEAYMREKLNDCPEKHIVNVMGEAEKYKVMKGGKFKEWKLDLQDAISVFCDWMNEYKGPGTLDRSKINILAATDAAVKAPEQQTTFNIENTNMSDMEFNIRMTKERGYHIDMTDCACYLDISLLEQAGKVDEFISKFCIKQELSEGTEETADIAIALPKVVLLDIGADGKCNSYNTVFCIKSSMFMALQPYMYGLMQLTGRVM